MDEEQVQTIQKTDAPTYSSSEEDADGEIEIQEMQHDVPAKSSSQSVKSPKRNPPRRARQSRARQEPRFNVNTIEEDNDSLSEDEILSDVDAIAAGPSHSQKKKKTPVKLRKGVKRKRDPAFLPRCNNASAFEASWREVDKRRLLVALQRYGILDINQLIKSVPGKTEEEIRKFIAKRWKMARTELRAHLRETRKSKGENSGYLGPVDKWLEELANFYPNYDHYKINPIAHAMLLIWKYEKHPDPSECGETLKNFASRVKNGNWSGIVEHMKSPLKINTSKRPPASEDDVIAALSYSKEKCIEELAKLSGFNPFSIPSNLLKKKDVADNVTLD
ncbi:hypothetical protein R5R35_003687 [Gryllus longicercus]|uniref:Uncharacterized protein n=1 Tax=Gryllus longicercus TaxID=2509291 RepID=A0AAN9YZ67_9ORTH